MAGLLCFPWNSSNCSVHDKATLLSDSWLSNFHIDYVLSKISNHHSNHYGTKTSSCHTILPIFDLNSIITTYKNTLPSGHTADKDKELLEVENRIICDLVDSVAGVLHLPNHWTSVIISFNPPRILYSNSLGDPMPAKMADSFWQWICHTLTQSGNTFQRSDISIFPLEITI